MHSAIKGSHEHSRLVCIEGDKGAKETVEAAPPPSF